VVREGAERRRRVSPRAAARQGTHERAEHPFVVDVAAMERRQDLHGMIVLLRGRCFVGEAHRDAAKEFAQRRALQLEPRLELGGARAREPVDLGATATAASGG
jgi:hypothetical protein